MLEIRTGVPIACLAVLPSIHSTQLSAMKTVKYIVYSLLTIDTILIFCLGTPNEALESTGWVILLAVLEYESSSLHEAYASRWEKYALIGVQAIAYGIVTYALARYWWAKEWLDFGNSLAWLLVCIAIAYDIYGPKTALPSILSSVRYARCCSTFPFWVLPWLGLGLGTFWVYLTPCCGWFALASLRCIS
jgi:hypothetical protein